ncbi:hypothetical protein [Photobacterium leiognathi]|uniref:hypothetical protein n=1 Tax=Photobacterium leiognathi TaxID=553611 RepID=UPI002980F4F8|nr:hypothetical protein [Photobacterium leiognathi]
MSEKDQQKRKLELGLHKLFTLSLYVISFGLTYFILNLAINDDNSTIVLIISSGAIVATFGSALSAIAGMWERDLLERVLENTDILFADISKSEKWRRWPFIPRSRVSKQLNGDKIVTNLTNAQFSLNVGTHHITVDIPTVLDDFFDLPVIKNTYTLCRYRSAASTTLLKGKSENVTVETASGLEPFDEYMAYENLYSSWVAIFKFRLFRYLGHFGASLTILGALLTLFYCVKLYA